MNEYNEYVREAFSVAGDIIRKNFKPGSLGNCYIDI